MLGYLHTAIGDAAIWKDMLWLLILLPILGLAGFMLAVCAWGVALGMVFLPLWYWSVPDGVDYGLFTVDKLPEAFGMTLIGLVLLVVAAPLTRAAGYGVGALARGVLAPSERRRLMELERTRAGAVDAQAAELQRIERDLHDGAQARLVALAMDLGMAQEKMATDPEGAQELITGAHSEAKKAIAELRDLSRGIYPAILTDRGLGPALSSIAARNPVEVALDVDLDERLPAATEAAAYFVTVEALTNVAKHSGAANAPRAHRPPRRAAAGGDRRRRRRRRRPRRRGPDRPAPARRGARREARRAVRRPRDHDPGGAAMRIVIAEDLTLLREGLTRLLRDRGWEIVAAVDNGPALVDAIVEHRPDLALVDVRLPPSFTDEGVRAAIEARERVPGTPVLILSQYVEESYAGDLLASEEGGVGYLLKDRVADVRQFTESLQRVAGGGTAMDPEVVAQLLGRRDNRGPLAELTPREVEVLTLMAEGRSNTGIGMELGISASAIEKHVKQVFMKLDLPPSDSDHRRVLAVLKFLGG